MPNLDVDSKFGPMTSDLLGESSLNMFKALMRLIEEWPHKEMLSQDPPAAVTNVAKHYSVSAFHLRHLFATFWFEYIDELTLKCAQVQRDAQLKHLEEVFTNLEQEAHDHAFTYTEVSTLKEESN